MKLRMYSLLDKKMEVYLTPFFSRNDVDAGRQLSASLRDPQMAQSPIALAPGDFDLVAVGDFDDDTGVITPYLPGQRTLIPVAQFAP